MGGDSNHKEAPDYGWNEPIPSHDGGDSEADFMRKPPYSWQPNERFETKYTVACWCGRVQFDVADDPLNSKCCHCKGCQRFHGAPFQLAALFHKVCWRLTKNEDESLTFFSADKKSSTHYVPCKAACSYCRSPLFDEGRNLVLAYPGSFRFKDGKMPDAFKPKAHIFYADRIMECVARKRRS